MRGIAAIVTPPPRCGRSVVALAQPRWNQPWRPSMKSRTFCCCVGSGCRRTRPVRSTTSGLLVAAPSVLSVISACGAWRRQTWVARHQRLAFLHAGQWSARSAPCAAQTACRPPRPVVAFLLVVQVELAGGTVHQSCRGVWVYCSGVMIGAPAVFVVAAGRQAADHQRGTENAKQGAAQVAFDPEVTH